MRVPPRHREFANLIRHSWAPVLAAVAGTIALLPTRARAAPLSDCTARHGTIVVVDFAHWGGPVVRGCGISQPSGYALLHKAGFTTAGDAHDGPGIICRLGDAAFHDGTQYPTPSEDACIVTPPVNAYWAYWLAPAGQDRWTYSPLGATGDVPKSGEVELWTFGATNVGGTSGSGVPRFTPNSLRPYLSASGSATTTTTTSTTTSPTTTTTQSTTSHAATTTRSTETHHTPARRTAGKQRHPKPKGARRPAAHHRAGGGTPVLAAKPTSERSSAGSALPLVIGLCLAIALCGGAGWTAWRRRQYE